MPQIITSDGDLLVIQEQRISVKSGNPYRTASGRFGTGGDQATTNELDDKIAGAEDMPVETALYNYQDYAYQDINSYLYYQKKQADGKELDEIDQKGFDKILTKEDNVLSHIKAIDGQFAKEPVKDQHLYRTDPNLIYDMIESNPKLKSELATLASDGKIPKNHQDMFEGGDDYIKTLEKHLVGQSYTSGAYISTSRNMSGAEKFGDGSSLSKVSAEARITLTGKSKGIRVDDFTGSGVEGNIENETLLPRGTGFKINGIRLTPTQREGYSGTRGEVFFVEISGEIIPIDVTDPNSRKKALGEMANTDSPGANVAGMTTIDGEKVIVQETRVSVKSGNPYRGDGGRFGTGPGKTGDTTEDLTDTVGETEWESYAKQTFGEADLSTEAQAPVKKYFDQGYSSLNSDLRKYQGKYEKSSNSDFINQVQVMDKATSMHTLDKSYAIYRGSTLSPDMVKVGTKIKDYAYSSASLSRYRAEEFASSFKNAYNPIVIRLVAPKGTKGFIPSASQLRGIIHGEAEIVLPRGTEFTITKVTSKKDYTLVEGQL